MSQPRGNNEAQTSNDGNSRSEISQFRNSTRPTRHRQTRNGPTTQHRQVKWYEPSALLIYDTLFNIEKKMLESAGTHRNYVAVHLLACRIYYAVIFHMRILMARRNAQVATPDEISVLEQFNATFHTDTLPIHTELIELFRDALPFQVQHADNCAIAPTQQKFVKFKFSDSQHGKVLQECEVPAPHIFSPSPRLGLHLLRWYLWNINQPEDDSLPDIGQRLAFIALGSHETFQVPDHHESNNLRRKTLQALFSNPIFKHPLPTPGGLNIELLAKLGDSDPPQIDPMANHADRSTELLSELLVNNGTHWFNQMKYIVSHLCTFSEGFSFTDELDEPYYPEEMEYVLKLHEEQNVSKSEIGYPSFGIWMSIFSSSTEYPVHPVPRSR